MHKIETSTDGVWVAGKLNEPRKAIRKAMVDTLRAYDESKKANQPIVGFRPEYPSPTQARWAACPQQVDEIISSTFYFVCYV